MRSTVESMLRAGQPELVLQEADRYFKDPPANDPDAQWIALRAVQAAGVLAAWGQAVSWADRGWATNPSEEEVGGWLHFYKGTALMHVGDLFQAEVQLQKFLDAATGMDKLRWFAGDALFNIGHVKRALGKADHGAPLFDEAARSYEAAGRLGQVPGCTYEIGWGLLLAGESGNAVPYLESASGGLEQSDEPELAAKLDIAWSLRDNLVGAVERSNQLAHNILAQHRLLPEQSADCDWVLGRNAVTVGDLVAAKLHAESAYAAAIRYWWPPQLDRINGLKADIGRVTSVDR